MGIFSVLGQFIEFSKLYGTRYYLILTPFCAPSLIVFVKSNIFFWASFDSSDLIICMLKAHLFLIDYNRLYVQHNNSLREIFILQNVQFTMKHQYWTRSVLLFHAVSYMRYMWVFFFWKCEPGQDYTRFRHPAHASHFLLPTLTLLYSHRLYNDH